jgi:hypothetical protein
MIRFDDGNERQALTLPKACQWIGERTGKTPATSTAWRWVLRGVRGGIKLESFRVGGTTFTTPEMLKRFIDRTSATIASSNASPSIGTAAPAADHDARRQEIAAAQDRLRQLCEPKRRRKGDGKTGRDDPRR